MNEKEAELKESIAKIEAGKETFKASPLWFTICKTLNIAFWLGFWLIAAQCTCKCIIK